MFLKTERERSFIYILPCLQQADLVQPKSGARNSVWVSPAWLAGIATIAQGGIGGMLELDSDVATLVGSWEPTWHITALSPNVII